MKFIRCGFLLLAVWSSLASAQGSAQQEQLTKTFRGVMRNEIPLTPKVHEQFWSELRNMSTNQQADFVRLTSNGAIEAHAYQIEVWQSALLSFQRQKIIKTEKMSALEREMRSNILGSLPKNIPKDSMRASIEAFEAKYQESIQQSKLVLEVAAKHQILRLPGVADIEMNEDSIRSIADSLNETNGRVQKLLSPVWIDGAHSNAQVGTPVHRPYGTDETDTTIRQGNESGKPSKKTTTEIDNAVARHLKPNQLNEFIQRGMQASLVRPENKRLIDASIEQANFEQRIGEEARPTGWEMFGAAVDGSTLGRILRSFTSKSSDKKFSADPDFKPDRKLLPYGSSSELINQFEAARSSAQVEHILQRYNDEQTRRKAVANRGEGKGIAMSLTIEVAIWITLALIVKFGWSSVFRPNRTSRFSIEPSLLQRSVPPSA